MEHAIKVMDLGSLGIVLVVDEDERLIGTVTDGDIRRALIRRCGMYTPISQVMFRNPTVASVNEDRGVILSVMRQRLLLHMPLVDENGRVTGLETLQHLTEAPKFENIVFLMAGGYGQRLRPLTLDLPKPLLKLGSKPILQIILEQFVAFGFHNFYISTHYKAEMVREHFGDGEQWGINIKYIHETEPLGTAGALGMLPKDLDIPILMVNGDLLTKVNYQQLLRFHDEHQATATVCVREYDFQVPFGVVEAKQQQIVNIIEKPVQQFFVNAGIYVLSPEIVGNVKANTKLDMPEMLTQEIGKDGSVVMFPIHEYWLDIGRLDQYEKAHEEYSVLFDE